MFVEFAKLGRAIAEFRTRMGGCDNTTLRKHLIGAATLGPFDDVFEETLFGEGRTPGSPSEKWKQSLQNSGLGAYSPQVMAQKVLEADYLK